VLESIGNALGKYIDCGIPKDYMFSFDHLCVEVYLEKGLPWSIILSFENKKYLQQVDYENLPFKCHHCHEYGNFSWSCSKKYLEGKESENANEQLQLSQRIKNTNRHPKTLENLRSGGPNLANPR